MICRLLHILLTLKGRQDGGKNLGLGLGPLGVDYYYSTLTLIL